MLTSAQIVQQILQICKVPGYTSQAGQLLNVVLGDLAQSNDFDILRKLTVITTSGASASYSLASDHLRTREVFYSISGEPFFLTQIPLEDYDKLFEGAGVSSYPTMYATDLGQVPPGQPGYSPVMYFWPPPSMALSVNVRYQAMPADITTPESSATVPWFPNQRYLIKQVAADLMMLTDDERQQTYAHEAEDILRKYLMMDDDKEGYVRQVKLDGRSFRNPGGLKATKVLPL